MMRSYEDVVTRLEEFARALTIHLGAMDVDEPPVQEAPEASRPPRPSLPPPVQPRASRAPSVPIVTGATPGAPPAPPKSILKKHRDDQPRGEECGVRTERRHPTVGAGGCEN
jgi:hypothetical protein